MSDRDNEMLDQATDPPDNQGGGDGAMNLDAPGGEAEAIDPPDNQGGGAQ